MSRCEVRILQAATLLTAIALWVVFSGGVHIGFGACFTAVTFSGLGAWLSLRDLRLGTPRLEKCSRVCIGMCAFSFFTWIAYVYGIDQVLWFSKTNGTTIRDEVLRSVVQASQ